MSTQDWEEVKRLAADFQRAQLSSGVSRLSERNCIEIINHLIERKQIEVFFTTDGKEYITPQYLIKEIQDELFMHEGRINLVELAKSLSVDLSIIQKKVDEIVKSDSSIKVVNGQLISDAYITALCKEIDDKLQQQGQINVEDLTSQYDLSSEFLLFTIEKQLGKIIKAQQDKQNIRVFFTDSFIERVTCKVRGTLMAVTKPTSVDTIINVCGIQEGLFFSVFNKLSDKHDLAGSITGKKGLHSLFIPTIYSKSQTEWVDSFYEQNGYLEFSALTRLGISDPITYIKKHFTKVKMIIMSTCAVGPVIFDQVEAAIDDVISSGTFVNVLSLLPTVFEEKDAEVIINEVLKKKSSHNLRIFNSTIVATDYYLNNLLKLFDQVVEKKAEECVDSGKYLKAVVAPDKLQMQKRGFEEDKFETKGNRKEERRKKANEGKGGGGTQGRETKTKATKKKYMKNAQHDDDDDDYDYHVEIVKSSKSTQQLEIITLKDIKAALTKQELLQEEENPEILIDEVAKYLQPKLNKNAMDIAKTYYESTVASINQDRRKKFNEMQEKLNDLVVKVRLFEKGYKQFTGKEIQQQLAKYLLKTLCTDITNDIFSYVSEGNAKTEGKEMTSELRAKILNDVPNDIKDTLLTLHKSLASSSVDDFLNIIETAAGPGICDIILKKPDKKKERPHLINHRQQLIEQLNVSDDPALVLHLATLIIFQGVTQTILHASGRFVSNILTFLQTHLPSDSFNTLQRYHDLVLKFLSTSDASEKSSAQKTLLEDMQQVKDIALSYKKEGEKARQPSE